MRTDVANGMRADSMRRRARVAIAAMTLVFSGAAPAASLGDWLSGKTRAEGTCLIKIEALDVGHLATLACLGEPSYFEQVATALQSAPRSLIGSGGIQVRSPSYADKVGDLAEIGSYRVAIGSFEASARVSELLLLQDELDQVAAERDALRTRVADAASDRAAQAAQIRGHVVYEPAERDLVELARHQTAEAELQERLAQEESQDLAKGPAPTPIGAQSPHNAPPPATTIVGTPFLPQYKGFAVELGIGPFPDPVAWNRYRYTLYERKVLTTDGPRSIVYAGPFSTRDKAAIAAESIGAVFQRRLPILAADLVLTGAAPAANVPVLAGTPTSGYLR